MTEHIVHCFVMPRVVGGFFEYTTCSEKEYIEYIERHFHGLHGMQKNRDYLMISVPEDLVANVIMRYKEYYLTRDLVTETR